MADRRIPWEVPAARLVKRIPMPIKLNKSNELIHSDEGLKLETTVANLPYRPCS